MKFKLSKTQKKKLKKWLKVIKKEAALNSPDPDMPEYPKNSSIDYIFTPTGIGTLLIVKESITGKELDLTEMDNW